jgi:hypothetical protein
MTYFKVPRETMKRQVNRPKFKLSSSEIQVYNLFRSVCLPMTCKFLGNIITHLLQLIFISHCCHLQVALDLLADLLEAVYYRQAWNCVYAAQRIETHPWQVVLPGDLPKVDNGLPYTITSQK